MAAPKGNTFYQFVQKPTGRPKKYSPNRLWKKAQLYFDWITKNPLYEQKSFANGTVKNVPKMRAMTELTFCLYAGIDRATWRHYKSGDADYKDFFIIANTIADIIYSQKLEGAASDLLNANIIARHLGLKEHSELTGKDGKPLISKPPPIDLSHFTLEQLETLLTKDGRNKQ